MIKEAVGGNVKEIRAIPNGLYVEVCHCSCTETTIQEIIVQHSSRISSTGQANFSCSYQSPVKEQCQKPRSISSVNMMQLPNVGVMLNTVNTDIGKCNFLVELYVNNIQL
jgi:alpha-D-ribose 1-methylphosphonate 5-phosphate C-P lyase